jgi:glutamine amidotransferase
MQSLRSRGLVEILRERVFQARVPVLGICLGMQLMTMESEEGREKGLGWLPGVTRKFSFSDAERSLKIPHMGWNTVEVVKKTEMSENLPQEPRFYFAHSYYVQCENAVHPLFMTNHGHSFCSGFQYDSIIGVQFHPEKSHSFGMTLLKNFCQYIKEAPSC